MPYLSMRVSRKLNEEERKTLEEEAGRLIALLPGKSEEGLMVDIDDGAGMRFRGVSGADCMYVDVRMYLASPHESKVKLADALLEAIRATTGIGADDVYMTFSEYPHWVVRGRML